MDKQNKIKNLIIKLGNLFLDEIYPKDVSCYACNKEIVISNEFHLCENCLKEIKRIKYCCVKCGDELNTFTSYCHNCKNKKRYFDKCVSFSKYNGVAKNLVYKLKYNKQKFIADSIYPFMLQVFNDAKFCKIDYIVGVPLSKERFKERGFNQSELLCNKLSKILNIPTSNKILQRVKDTKTQTKLSKQERIENVKNAFDIIDKRLVKNKTFLIIDDVITTGATLDEIAKTLKSCGATKVYGLTFCHD